MRGKHDPIKIKHPNPTHHLILFFGGLVVFIAALITVAHVISKAN